MNPTKEMRSRLRAENRNWPAALKPVSVLLWPKDGDSKRKAVWRSRGFLVQVFEEWNGGIRLSVNRTDCDKNGKWIDGITWEELMQIKRECGFGPMLAVEFYPPDKDVVNVANMRHLFIVFNNQLPEHWKK